MHLLVTGGAGYIGSHTCLELLQAGHRVTVVDNLSNASRESLRRVESLSGRELRLEIVDLMDRQRLAAVFSGAPEPFHAVIHFAGLKAVGESVAEPLRYYRNNLVGTLTLCEVMAEFGVRNIIFSSSATVYGEPELVPITEDFPLACTNPYGRTKLMVEEVLRDLHGADPRFSVVLLRYFNPAGAHPSGLIGEDPRGIPNNLTPYITQVAIGRLEAVSVFGDDYSTPDGTGVRDYIHVVDLARGHVKALECFKRPPAVAVYNLGTGRGYSVLEMIQAFSRACGSDLAYRIAPRRPGDVAACYADPSKAARELGWRAELGLDEMCRDAWNWQLQNPEGY